MRARVFAALIIVLFALSIMVSVSLIMKGYGLPSSYSSIYYLDSYNILVGISKEVGKPIVYEWNMVALLKPGDTEISIKVGSLTGFINLGNVSITLFVMGKKYVEYKPVLNITIHRNNIFLVARIRVEIRNPHPIHTVPMVSVNLSIEG